MTHFEPYKEPLSSTVIRTGLIAAGIGGIISSRMGGLAAWPQATLLTLWFSFGGHWVELGFLNGLRPHLPGGRVLHFVARLMVWFIGGVLLWLGMMLTARAISGNPSLRWPEWWIGGAGFIGIELLVHVVLMIFRRPSIYDGRG